MAHFEGENFLIEQTKDVIVRVESIVMTLTSVGNENETHLFFFQLLYSGPKRFIGSEDIGHSFDEFTKRKLFGSPRLKKSIEVFAVDFSRLIIFLQRMIDEKLAHLFY